MKRNKPKKNNRTSRWEWVTPERAAKMLKHNRHNRTRNEAFIDRLARDIKAGNFTPNHLGIAFGPDGILLDGQNRLHAIVRANQGVELHVTRNLPREAQSTMDLGTKRTTAQVLALEGGFGKVTKDEIACLRALVKGMGGQFKHTLREEAALLTEHREAIQFAISCLSRSAVMFPGVCSAITRAVIARAFYSVPSETLERFCEILMHGSGKVADRPVVLLMRWLGASRTQINMAARGERYGRTARALYAYIHGENLKKLYTATQELFPLPGEKPSKRTRKSQTA